MNLTFVDITLGVCFLTIFILATVLLFKSRSASGRLLSLTSYGSAFWILVSFVFYRIESGPVLFFAKMQYIVGALVINSFLLFVVYFVGKDIQINKNISTGIVAFFAAFTILILTTGLFIRDAQVSDGYKTMVYGPLYFFYIIYIFLVLALGYYHFFKKFIRTADKIIRSQIIYISAGTFVSVSIAIVFDVVLPVFDKFQFLWMGPATTAFFIAFISYAILRHNLFNIKVIATEIFVFAILVTLFVQALSSEGLKEFSTRMIFFVVISFLSLFLLKSIYKEISQRKKIERLAFRLSDFVSFTTHELRTPVGKFKSVLSMMLEGEYGEISSSVKEWLKRSYETAVDMEQNIETFLSLNKLEIDRLEIFKQEVDFQNLVSTSIYNFIERAKGKNIKMSFKRRENIPHVFVDKFQMRHVIGNLVSNAIKYTPEGGQIDIFVREDKKNNRIILSVKDSGLGIVKEDLFDLFERYDRVSEEAKVFSEGSGIGLYLAKKLVELHGGEIWAESEGRGKGSIFSFSIPIQNK